MKFLFIILIILGIICKNTINKIDNHLIYFDLTNLPKTTIIKLSDLGVIDIDYIPLETNERSFISGNFDLTSMGSRIVAGNDFYIIKHFNTIKKFRDDGSFVVTIGRVGRGPDEFLTAHDIDVCSKTQEIYIADGWQKKFYVYSDKGDFVRSFAGPVNTSVFRITPDGILCYSTNVTANIKYSYNLIDTNGKITKEITNKYPWNLNSKYGAFVFEENIFYEYKNQLFKKEIYSDTVYAYNNGSFKPHLVFAHGKRLLTTQARTDLDPMELMENYISQQNIFEFGDYVYYEFLFNRHKYTFIGSKKRNFKALMINELDMSSKRFKGFVNDIDGGPSLLPYTVKNENTLVCIADAFIMKNYITSQEFKDTAPKYPKKKQELESLVNSLKEDDNAVLILIKIK
ncbi:MAG TPA: 6-bladed beta-propeller [Candidatus Cloacimonadota bacterium]|nr:6-bladed beta-propeller [Candidatus Cloacimonadota bacterium]